MDIHLPLGYLNGKQMGPTTIRIPSLYKLSLRKPASVSDPTNCRKKHAVTWTFTPECWLVVVPDTSQVPPEALEPSEVSKFGAALVRKTEMTAGTVWTLKDILS